MQNLPQDMDSKILGVVTISGALGTAAEFIVKHEPLWHALFVIAQGVVAVLSAALLWKKLHKKQR